MNIITIPYLILFRTDLYPTILIFVFILIIKVNSCKEMETTYLTPVCSISGATETVQD